MKNVRFSSQNDSVILATGFEGNQSDAEIAVDEFIEGQQDSEFIGRSGQAPDYDETTDTFYFGVKNYA